MILRSRLSTARPGASPIATLLEALHGVESALGGFYRTRRARLTLSIAASLCELAIGAVAVYLALGLLGRDALLVDAVAIEAVVLLVTGTFFFVPANIGTQEAALVFVCEASSDRRRSA